MLLNNAFDATLKYFWSKHFFLLIVPVQCLEIDHDHRPVEKKYIKNKVRKCRYRTISFYLYSGSGWV